jgi:hypothetical protein
MKNDYLEDFLGLCILYPSVLDAIIGFQALDWISHYLIKIQLIMLPKPFRSYYVYQQGKNVPFISAEDCKRTKDSRD